MTGGEGTPPVVIVRPETNVTSGTAVQEKLISAARAFADILKPTLGPRGLDKMLYKTDGTTAVTNDGAKIVAELMVRHPAAKAFVSLAESQENACGDGVTRSLLVAGELLVEADRLIRMGLHPLTIVDGYLAALQVVEESIHDFSKSLDDVGNDALLSVAKTALRGKSADQDIDNFAKIVSESTRQITRETPEGLRSEAEDVSMYLLGRKGIKDSYLLRGIQVRRRVLLDRLEGERQNLRVAVIHGDLKARELHRDAEIEVESPEQLSGFITEENERKVTLVENLLRLDIGAIFVSGEVDRDILHHLVDEGVFVADGFDDSELRNLCGVTQAKLSSSVHHLTSDDIGRAESVNCERRTATDRVEDEIVVIGGEHAEIVTIAVGGTEGAAAEEVVRGLHDALRSTTLAMRTDSLLPGAGATHIRLAMLVRTAAEQRSDRAKLAMNAFSRALDIVPATLVENAGGDSLDSILALRASSLEEQIFGIGIDGNVTTVPGDVLHPTETILNGIIGATETACSLLRIDQVISARGD